MHIALEHRRLTFLEKKTDTVWLNTQLILQKLKKVKKSYSAIELGKRTLEKSMKLGCILYKR